MQNFTEQELLARIKELEEENRNLRNDKKYGLIWEDKPEEFNEKSRDSLPILQEDVSLRIDDSENKPYNIIIEWDNYHSLSTLSYTHQRKIDVIYIDPPYNTGNKDFIYNDNYVDKEDSYRHSKWLSFMSKRLQLARDLLTREGSIFISIDDNEQANLKLLCDKIFGENNLLKTLVWESGKPFWFKATKTTWPRIHEYILHYAKDINNIWYNPTYTEIVSSTWEKILTWSLIKVETDKIYSMDFIQGAKESVVKYGLESFGSWQKPIKLIQKFILAGWNKNSTILDFFAWSGTTGHAVMELNKEDGWNRQFILCSNRENTKENPEKNICRDITYERNKRVIQGYTNAKWEQVEWLWWNLRYYKTEFIPKNKSIDDLRDSFINKCDDLLCIKENTFTKVNFWEEIPELKIFKNKNNFTVILYDIDLFELLKNKLRLFGPSEHISLYLFTMSHPEIFVDEIQTIHSNTDLKNIPDDILEVYLKIFNA